MSRRSTATDPCPERCRTDLRWRRIALVAAVLAATGLLHALSPLNENAAGSSVWAANGEGGGSTVPIAPPSPPAPTPSTATPSQPTAEPTPPPPTAEPTEESTGAEPTIQTTIDRAITTPAPSGVTPEAANLVPRRTRAGPGWALWTGIALGSVAAVSLVTGATIYARTRRKTSAS